jgi:hypothetical protein
MEGLKGLKMTTKYVAQKRRDRLLILEAEKAQSQAFWDELCAKSEKQRGEESCQSNDSEGNGEELLQPEPTG